MRLCVLASKIFTTLSMLPVPKQDPSGWKRTAFTALSRGGQEFGVALVGRIGVRRQLARLAGCPLGIQRDGLAVTVPFGMSPCEFSEAERHAQRSRSPPFPHPKWSYE